MPPTDRSPVQYKLQNNPFVAANRQLQQQQTGKEWQPSKKSVRASVQKMATSSVVSSNPWKDQLLKKTTKPPVTSSTTNDKASAPQDPKAAPASGTLKPSSLHSSSTATQSASSAGQQKNIASKQEPAQQNTSSTVTTSEKGDGPSTAETTAPQLTTTEKQEPKANIPPAKLAAKESETPPPSSGVVKTRLNLNSPSAQTKANPVSHNVSKDTMSPSSLSSTTTRMATGSTTSTASPKQDRIDASPSHISKVSKATQAASAANDAPPSSQRAQKSSLPIASPKTNLAAQQSSSVKKIASSLAENEPSRVPPKATTPLVSPRADTLPPSKAGSDKAAGSTPSNLSLQRDPSPSAKPHPTSLATQKNAVAEKSTASDKQAFGGQETHEPPVDQPTGADQLPWMEFATSTDTKSKTEATGPVATSPMMADPAEMQRQLAVSHAVLTALSFPTLSIDEAEKWHKRSDDARAALADMRNRALTETQMQRSIMSLHKLAACPDRDFLQEMQQRTDTVDNLIQELYYTFSHVCEAEARYLRHLAGTLAVTVHNEESWHEALPSMSASSLASSSSSLPSGVTSTTATMDPHVIQRINTLIKKCKGTNKEGLTHRSAAETGSDEDDHDSVSDDSFFSRSVRTSATSVSHLTQTDVNSMLDDLEKHLECFIDDQTTRWQSEHDAIVSQCRPILGQNASPVVSTMVAQVIEHFGKRVRDLEQAVNAKQKTAEPLEQQCQRQRAVIEDLERQLKAKTERQEALESQLHERPSVDAYRALQAQVSDLEAIKQTARQTSEADTRHVEQLQARIMELERQYETTATQLQANQRLLDQSLSPEERLRLEARVTELERELQRLSDKVPSVPLDTLHAHIAKLECQIESKQSELQSVKALDQSKAARITELEKQLQEAQTRLERSANKEGRQTLDQLQAAFQAAQEEFTRRESALMLQSASVEAELEQVLREYDRLTRNIVDFNRERKKYETEITELHQAKQMLEKQLADYKIKEDIGKDGQSMTLRREFRQLMASVKIEHQKELERERGRCRIIEEEMRDMKRDLEMKRWDTINIGVQTHFVAYDSTTM